jgi:hypothetical protein
MRSGDVAFTVGITYSLRLSETTQEDEKAEIVWRWGRVEGQPRVFNDRLAWFIHGSDSVQSDQHPVKPETT